jgi:AraC-like DNA-binding protein
MCIYDMEAEFRLITPVPTHILMLTVPKESLQLSPKQAALATCRKIERKPGLVNIMASFLASMSTESLQLDSRSLIEVTRATNLLLSSMLRENLGDDPGRVHAAAELIAAVRQFIGSNISNPDLSPAVIADAFHISLRKLYRAFEEADVSIGREIRTQRLNQCAKDLRNPALREEKVSTIAARSGIDDAAKFSRQFKSQFGMSPREYREAHRESKHDQGGGTSCAE